jgi:hypothetical protein
LHPHEGARCTQWAPGCKTGSILAPSALRPASGAIESTASNLDTLLDRGFGRRVRMLLSFQRPSHRFRRDFLLRGVRDPGLGSRSGPISIPPDRRGWKNLAAEGLLLGHGRSRRVCRVSSIGAPAEEPRSGAAVRPSRSP